MWVCPKHEQKVTYNLKIFTDVIFFGSYFEFTRRHKKRIGCRSKHAWFIAILFKLFIVNFSKKILLTRIRVDLSLHPAPCKRRVRSVFPPNSINRVFFSLAQLVSVLPVLRQLLCAFLTTAHWHDDFFVRRLKPQWFQFSAALTLPPCGASGAYTAAMVAPRGGGLIYSIMKTGYL